MRPPRFQRLRAALVCGAAVSLTILAPRAALAGPEVSAEDSAAAERLFEEGRAFMAEGTYEQACAKFAASQELDPAVGTLLNLGECFERRGLTASAWATYRQAETAAERQGQRARATFAAEHASALEPKLGRVVVEVASGARVPGLIVESDGRALPEGAWGTAIPNDPGERVVSAHADGHAPWSTTVTVSPGSRVTVAVPRLRELPQVAPVAPRRAGSRTQVVTGYGLAALGGVALGFGGFYGVRAFTGYGDANDNHCTPVDCDAIGVRAIQSAQTDATVSTVLFGVGLAAVAAGVVLIVTGSPGRAAQQAQAQTTAAGIAW